MLRHRWRTNNAGKPIYGYECKRHHDTPRIRLQNEQGNPTPVSYTHLDVYKRQVSDIIAHLNGKGIQAVRQTVYADTNALIDAGIDIVAVSYTHLDVYKRQGHGSSD